MDNHSRFGYGWWPETSWQSKGAGTAPQGSDRVAALERDLSEGCLGCEGVGELGGALESSLPSARENGLAHEADSRTAASVNAGADGEPDQAGAQQEGYATDLWTLRRVAELIEKRFGVYYGLTCSRRQLLQQ